MKTVPILAFLLAVSPSHAFAAACRLTAPDCKIIAAEMRQEEIMKQRDEKALAAINEYDRSTELAKRHAARLKAQAAKLRPVVVKERERMERCAAEARLATEEGRLPALGPICYE